MTEIEWARYVAQKLNTALPNYQIETGKKLMYANEIISYGPTENTNNEMTYETDILVSESLTEDRWIPRVILETKIKSVTTHDAITYSQKSATHKYVHPYLRYGIFIGYRKHHPLPGRLFRHGSHFDFMLSWQGFESTDYEWSKLIEIVQSEIKASQHLEEMIFNSRRSNREKYFALHKPLIVTQTPE